MSDTAVEQRTTNPKADEWAERIAAQQRSGISVKQFCRERGLTEYSFYAWRKRLQETLRFEAARGKTVLVTTHLVAEWNNVAHHCFLCSDGKIERELDPTNLPHNFDEMKNPDTAPTYAPQFSILH